MPTLTNIFGGEYVLLTTLERVAFIAVKVHTKLLDCTETLANNNNGSCKMIFAVSFLTVLGYRVASFKYFYVSMTAIVDGACKVIVYRCI